MKKTSTYRRAHLKRSVSTAPVRLTHPQKILDETSKPDRSRCWLIITGLLRNGCFRISPIVRLVSCAVLKVLENPCFFQKHVNSMLAKRNRERRYCQKQERKSRTVSHYIRTLLRPLQDWLSWGVLEKIHPWGSRNEDLETSRSDRSSILILMKIFPGTKLLLLQAKFCSGLKELGLESFVKTTGGKGAPHCCPH